MVILPRINKNKKSKRKIKFQKKIFQEKIFEIIKRIPKGKVLTYKEVAKLAGRPKAWRPVGNILNKNRDPKIPCHRVIRSDRRVGGYFSGTKKKISLLKKEGVLINNERVNKK
ncbi:MAG: MGMT family protein [Minisyncoccales bacterium]